MNDSKNARPPPGCREATLEIFVDALIARRVSIVAEREYDRWQVRHTVGCKYVVHNVARRFVGISAAYRNVSGSD
jgi:hypothetical protein